jgi:WD40 repeat protein
MSISLELYQRFTLDESINSMSFCDPHIALATSSKKVILFHINSKEIEHVFESHTDYVRSVDFSQDGHLIASGSDDTTVKIWNK